MTKSIKTVFLSFLVSSLALAGGYETKMDPSATLVETGDNAFGPDPSYDDHIYNAQDNLDVYGAKRAKDEPFYPFFFGRRLYPTGPFNEGLSILGKKNRLYPHFMGFGDWRFAYVYSDTGNDEKAEIVTRMNLDLDLKLTATERLHAFVRPFDKNGEFTGLTQGENNSDFGGEFEDHIDFNLDALFFEGDLGAMWSGLSGSWATFELPFAVGLMPMIFHNGIWLNDIFTGVAFTIPALNSRLIDISNMDLTFFAANDEINSAVSNLRNGVKLYGFNGFIEWFGGYMELGYGYTEDESLNDGDQSYHNVALSWTSRWKNHASLSYRVIGNFGQEDDFAKTADGALFLFESSLTTHRPYHFIPYINLFYGHDKPQPLARQEGGVLQNTGILFEADGMSAFPTLDPFAQDTWGGALGLQYLFELMGPQIVVEFATVQPHGPQSSTAGDEYGLGFRWQKPLSDTWILRADAIVGWRSEQEDVWGGRTELRWKF